jgi:16S rRNA (guanine527-N7)-methyltransferase
VLSPAIILELLEPFGLELSPDLVDKLLIYLELLLKWNSKINLVGHATAEQCVTRHFGESLFLSRFVCLQGRLLDIGSGAGFPGLALKILYPDLEVTLLEPVAKKRAFLKEVARVCQLDTVQALGDRLEDFYLRAEGAKFNFATSRAVGSFESLVQHAADCLKPRGQLCLWLGHEDAAKIAASESRFGWKPPQPVPLSQRREILVGEML